MFRYLFSRIFSHILSKKFSGFFYEHFSLNAFISPFLSSYNMEFLPSFNSFWHCFRLRISSTFSNIFFTPSFPGYNLSSFSFSIHFSADWNNWLINWMMNDDIPWLLHRFLLPKSFRHKNREGTYTFLPGVSLWLYNSKKIKFHYNLATQKPCWKKFFQRTGELAESDSHKKNNRDHLILFQKIFLPHIIKKWQNSPSILPEYWLSP